MISPIRSITSLRSSRGQIMFRWKLCMQWTETTGCASQSVHGIKAALLLRGNNIQKKNKAQHQRLKWMGVQCTCDQKHTSAMKITCSAAFSATCIILHLSSFVLMKRLGFKDTPRCYGASGGLKNVHTLRVRIEEWQCRASLCPTYQRQCSLCEQGSRVRLAFLSPSQLRSTNITLVPAFYSQGRVHGGETLLAFSTSSLVWFHNLPAVHTAVQWGMTAVPYIKPRKFASFALCSSLHSNI